MVQRSVRHESTFEHEFVWLASQSPRRSELLTLAGVAHRLLLPDAADDAEALEHERAGELPIAYVQRVTLAKLRAALVRRETRRLAAAPVLAADTTVVLGRRLLGKPADARQARATLAALSGRTHRVLTAVALHDGARLRRALSISRVRFAPLSVSTIEAYVASGEPFGKAGAYAIQGALAAHIEHIEGSHSGIMGLPLYETATLLRAARVRLPL
jgi:septum formation protein